MNDNEPPWRDASRAVRIGPIDARAMVFLTFALLHWAYWTFGLALSVIVLLWLLERRSLSVPAAIRRARAWVAGKHRPAVPWWAKSEFKNFSGR